jgi:iron complex transport system ATP-binding protein
MSDDGVKLEINALSAGYDKNCPVVTNMNLVVPRNRVVVLAGPNGCGKSTLIKVIARQLKPLAGNATLGGKDIYTMNSEEFAKTVAYVPQSIDFSNQLTVEELVRLGRNPHQRWWSWSENDADKQSVQNALVKAGLESLARRPFANLSGGEQKRALIATALAQEPTFILMDEPIAHLDFKHQLGLLSLISELKERSIGILLVLHDLNMIDRVADDIAFLKPEAGKPSHLFAKGERENVLTPENVAQIFDVKVEVFPDRSKQGRHFTIESI